MLIISGELEPARRMWAQDEFAITIWDRSDVLGKARDAGLLVEAEAFFAKTDELKDNKKFRPKLKGPELRDIELELAPNGVRGSDLIAKLKATSCGKADAKSYEILCQQILGYLFGNYLLEPRPQTRLEDGLNILDIVYRVSPQHPFWTTLTRDFRARVIVFECKNYCDPIGPMQVYTTERYISVGALRSICFVLSRLEPHEHAELAAFSAMRESGKPIIFLSDSDLEKVIGIRDAQLRDQKANTLDLENDPTIVLDQKIYDFIARLPR